MQITPLNQLRGQHLEATLGEACIFSNVNFNLENGQLLQVLGPNGAGKTSLLRLICGLLPPTQGQVLWGDAPIESQREIYHQEMTFIGHKAGMRETLSAVENLQMDCALTGGNSEAAIESALQQLGLLQAATILVRQLSAGQRRRLALCRLLLGTAVLWVLDEPFSNLDKDASTLLHGFIEQHVQQGGMVILTCHHDLDFPHLPIEYLRLE